MRYSLQNNTSYSNINVLYNSTQASNPSLFSNRTTQYSYGMNGQEKDDEIAQGIYSAMYWEYDSRLGRRWNLDPKPQISISDYAAFANNPIWFTDVYGDEVDYGKKGEGKVRNKINSFFSRVFSKSYRESYRGWRDAKTEDGTSIVYHLQKTADSRI